MRLSSSLKKKYLSIRLFLFFVALAFISFGSFLNLMPVSSVSSENLEGRIIRIASEGARPPFNYLEGDNKLAGFEIELGQELCRRMKVTCTFVPQEWEGLIPNLLSHQYDAIMSTLEITEDHLKQISFSKPYIRMPYVFLTSRSTKLRDVGPEGLKEATLGVEAGGAAQNYLEDQYIESKMNTYATLEDAILDLASERIDAVFGGKEEVMQFMKTRREAQCCKILGDIPRDPAYFGLGIGIGIRQEDKPLKILFDNALDAVVADGTYARIRARFFDFEIF